MAIWKSDLLFIWVEKHRQPLDSRFPRCHSLAPVRGSTYLALQPPRTRSLTCPRRVACAPSPKPHVCVMAAQGSTLSNYNADLVACIEDLRGKREELNKSVAKDEEEKAKIQNDLRILTERLARINDNLARKVSSRNEYDTTIRETEAAYSKIMESSQTLLHVLKRESVNLTKKKQASS